ncbi:MAG TPA: 50S ribosomal protein L20 [Dehalococcoidia bacterium]|nr:50S ribosomal protein L20 [Dehalococcoidia bacterium]
MPRVKGGTVTRRRHKKVLELTRGHVASKHKLYRRAHESMTHALKYAYRHRKELKGDMRRLWIIRINAATTASGLSYGRFINGLKKANVVVNRKVLAEMAVNDAVGFSKLIEIANKSLSNN